jgi:hypothetical protein
MEHCILKWIKHKFSNGLYIFNQIVNKSKTKLSPSQSEPQQTQSSHDAGPDHIGKKKAEKCGHPTKVRVFQTDVRPGVSNFESTLESSLESSLKSYLKEFDANGKTSNAIKDPIDDVIFKEIEESILKIVHDVTATDTQDLTRATNPKHDAITHVITIKSGTEPIKQKTRGVPQAYREELRKLLMDMKAAGMIVDSNSPWSSPIRLVKKPDGSIRLTIDFRKLNNSTVKDSYPLPRIEEIFTYLAKAKIYSSIDLAHGFHQIKLDVNSQPMTAFACQWGFFQYTVMPMGLCNSVATFSRVMAQCLDGLVGVIAVVYLDDVLVFSENIEDHYKHVETVIERLRQHNLKIKLSKCKFARRKIQFLSHIIEDGKISPNPAIIEAVSNAKPPKNVKQIQSFLGLASYYRKFIKNFSRIASPLINLTKKDVNFKWTDECQQAFQTLKMYLTSHEHVLILPDYNESFRLECDASSHGIGGVLSQKRGRHFQPIAYFSKHLSKTERNYSASERELLSIVLSVEHFKEYLYGRHFLIISDHEPLKFLATADVPAPRLARLQKRLMLYDYKIEYRAGILNGNADGLSRMLDEDDIVDDIDDDKTIFINAMHLRDANPKSDQTKDDNLKWIINLLKENTVRRPTLTTFANYEQRSLYKQWNRLKFFNNNLFREYIDKNDNDKIYYQYLVPASERDFILKNSHDSAVCGHLGYQKTYDRIMPKYYWYRASDDIKKYVEECIECQKFKSTNQYHRAKMQPISATRPNQILTTDIMGPIPLCDGKFKYILIICDHFTKYCEFFALESTTAQETAKKIIEFISRHSVPESILSDRGTNYQSELIAEVYELLDIHQLRTTAFWPQCDGQSERMCQSLQKMLACYVNDKKNNWAEFLPLLQFAYNSSVHATTKFSPFELTYGRQPRLPIDLLTHNAKLDLYLSMGSYAEQIQTQLAIAYEKVAKNTEMSILPHKISHDRKTRAASFDVNDFVWVLDTTKLKGVCKKLSNRYKGPYKIVTVIDDANYKIKTLSGSRLMIVNKARLKRCFPRRFMLELDSDSNQNSSNDSLEISHPNDMNPIHHKTKQ